MTAIEAAKLVDTEGCHVLRPRRNEPGQYDAKHFADGGNKRGWFYLDGFSASAIVQVHAALNDANKAKYEAFPIEKMADIAFKLIAKQRAA